MATGNLTQHARAAIGLLAAAMILTAVGCATTNNSSTTTSVYGTDSLADYGSALPSGVSLPPGFYPLAGHYDVSNPDDHYHGWPRYIYSERDRMIMVYVPTQRFFMGDGTQPDEVPGREAVVNHFYIDLHEVTNSQYHTFRSRCGNDQDFGMSPLARELNAHGGTAKDMDAYKRYYEPRLNGNHPARNVSWWAACRYSLWAGKSLPTEAQWEAAARGADRRIYPWGNDEHTETTMYLCNARTDRANYDGYAYTAPVLNYAAGVSPFGTFQMAGNVAEWCADWYDPGRYAYPSFADPASGLDRGAKAFGDANYPNPMDKILRDSRLGPLRGAERVVRGGSFADPIQRCRVDARKGARPESCMKDVGFRCVLVLPPDELTVAQGPQPADEMHIEVIRETQTSEPIGEVVE